MSGSALSWDDGTAVAWDQTRDPAPFYKEAVNGSGIAVVQRDYNPVEKTTYQSALENRCLCPKLPRSWLPWNVALVRLSQGRVTTLELGLTV